MNFNYVRVFYFCCISHAAKVAISPRLTNFTPLPYSYFAFFKPYGVLSQFTDEGDRKGLSHYLQVNRNTYPIGRLDADSEGLLLLTDNRSITNQLLHPRNAHRRTYLAQVEGSSNESSLQKLRLPLILNINGKQFKTAGCQAEVVHPPTLPQRDPPVRYRASIPDFWLRLTLQEGKNRQVRKMTAAVGWPTLRLVRTAIGKIELGTLQPGECIQLAEDEFFSRLGLRT